MVTDRTRTDVWQGMLDAARLGYYYQALADRHRRKHTVVRFLLIAAAAGGIGAALDALPDTVRLVAGAAVAAIAAWDLAADYARKAAVLHAVHIECAFLEIEWAKLWAAVDRPGADDAKIARENWKLAERLTEVTGRAGAAGVQRDEKLNEECAETAYRVVAGSYAV